MTMRPPPIRVKISLWYMLTLGSILLLFSFLLHAYLSRRLLRDLDDLLLSRAEGIIDSIDTYWEAERLDAIRDGARDYPFSKIDNENFARVVRLCLQEKSDDPVLRNITLQVFHADGRMIAAVKEFPGIPGISSQLDGRRIGRSDFGTLPIVSGSEDRQEARYLIVAAREGGRLAYIVRVISPLTEINRVLGFLRMIIWLLLPAIILAAGLAAAILAKISLRPVNAMIDTVARINAENLKLRVDVPAAQDEIRRLAETFNQMLGSVDRAFSMQQRFIQDVSHELRTPLTILKGELEVSLKRVRSAREYESVLQSNLEEIDRIGRLVENLLTLARFDSRQIQLDRKVFELTTLLRSVVEDVRVMAEQRRIEMRPPSSYSAPICGDEGQLARLFFNLLENAVKYTDAGGLVQIGMERQGSAVITTIRDDGVGIAADELPLIFDRFYRSRRFRDRGGFGLGLSIARSIAGAHGGKIAIASGPGRGTTVTVTLPAADA
jgi:heavy metal sensor kinase